MPFVWIKNEVLVFFLQFVVGKLVVSKEFEGVDCPLTDIVGVLEPFSASVDEVDEAHFLNAVDIVLCLIIHPLVLFALQVDVADLFLLAFVVVY